MVAYGEFIPIFGADHFIFIGSLLLIAFLLFFNKDLVRRNRDRITVVILLISIAQQILLYRSYYQLMGFDLGESLPLHISRINSILGILYLITKNERIFTVFSYFSLFAWMSFLYPSRVYGITHPLGISFFVNHVITLLLPYYGIIAYGSENKKEDKRVAYAWFLLYLSVAYLVNPLVEGNYFYLKHRPFFQNQPDPIYILLILLVTYLLFSMGNRLYNKIENNSF